MPANACIHRQGRQANSSDILYLPLNIDLANTYAGVRAKTDLEISRRTDSTMQAFVTLNQAGNVAYTNLDEISGVVVVRATRTADVSSILVKLEGESRTRLMRPNVDMGGPKPQLEYHKVS